MPAPVWASEEGERLRTPTLEVLVRLDVAAHLLLCLLGRNDVPLKAQDLILAELNARADDRVDVGVLPQVGERGELEALGARLPEGHIPSDRILEAAGLWPLGVIGWRVNPNRRQW